MMKNTIQISFMILVSVLLLIVTLSGCSMVQKGSAVSSEIPILGTWQTASAGYKYFGTYQPEYYVQFTKSEIIYGHLKDGEFVSDHSDRIILLEEIAPDAFKVQAESSAGTHYTYMTCESDNSILEYYGTWNKDEFPEKYSIGASLSRCD